MPAIFLQTWKNITVIANIFCLLFHFPWSRLGHAAVTCYLCLKRVSLENWIKFYFCFKKPNFCCWRHKPNQVGKREQCSFAPWLCLVRAVDSRKSATSDSAELLCCACPWNLHEINYSWGKIEWGKQVNSFP